MSIPNTSANLPLDITTRVEALFSLTSEIRGRVIAFPILTELIGDYQEMAKEFIMLFESKMESLALSPREKWLKRHEMLDKLTREWQLIYSLAASMELGSSHLEKFKPYVEQATQDVGLVKEGRDFLLIPVFGESFSLTKLGYSSSNISILNLPISIVHSPWELSVIWHEMAGLKVVEIREKIRDFLDSYARENHIKPPKKKPLPSGEAIATLFDCIVHDKRIEKKVRADAREFLSAILKPVPEKPRIWSQDWFEQLYEDACSVLAFGKDFVDVLEKILGRQARKLTADQKHPNMDTRLEVARRLLELQQRNAPPPHTETERLTDNLLWAFINQMKSDPVAALPVAYTTGEVKPEVRSTLIKEMQTFNANFGNLHDGTINETPFDFGAMSDFAEKASRQVYQSIPMDVRSTEVRKKLLEIFKDSEIDELLSKPFSPSDELDFESHTATQVWQPMYIGPSASTHGGHNVFHISHA